MIRIRNNELSMSAAAEPSRKRARTQVASGDALDDDFTISEDFAAPTPLANPNAKAASTCNKGGGKAAALGHTRPLSKRQARKGRAVARAVGLPLGAGAGAGVIAIEGGVTLASASASASAAPAPLKYSKFDAAASTIIPWAPAADLALSLWALFRSSNVGSALSELEFVEPLTSSGVFPYPERLRGAVSGIVRAVLSRAAREAAGESRAQNGAAAPALIIITHSAPRASGLLRELSVFKTRIGKIFSSDAAAGLRVGPPISICVGTPHRIRSVLADGALSLDKCNVVLIDATLDSKRLCVLTERASREDWWGLYADLLHVRVRAGETKLAVIA